MAKMYPEDIVGFEKVNVEKRGVKVLSGRDDWI